jgi:hypothetical protein
VNALVRGLEGVRFFEVLSTVASKGFRVIHAMVVASCEGVEGGQGGCLDVPLGSCCCGGKENVPVVGG